MADFIDEHAVHYFGRKRFLRALEELALLVDKAAPETELQAHLEVHPCILSLQFSHCHHVFPKIRLGTRYESDFFCLEMPSYGEDWWDVELEVPQNKVITKSGRKSAKLEHALQQIRDWRRWMENNLEYARRAKENDGLGLENIRPHFFGCVIIGRRCDCSSVFNTIRSQVLQDERISIRSWDGIIEWARKQVGCFSNTGKL